ncbi:MAG: ABC transporter permease subunit [Methanocella sp.]
MARIASIEFSRVLKHPLTILVALLLFALAVINGAGSAHLIPRFDLLQDGNDHFFSVGISNTINNTSMYMMIVSTFVGVLSLFEERARGSLRVLITKPVYRRDILAGKFLGLAGFIMMLLIVDVSLCVASIMIFYEGPQSGADLLFRISSYIIVLFIACLFMLSFTFLIGMLFKDYMRSLIIAGTVMFFEWFYMIPVAFGDLRNLNPVQLCFNIIGHGPTFLFYTSLDYGQWLSGALPYAALLLAETLAALAISAVVFSTDET